METMIVQRIDFGVNSKARSKGERAHSEYDTTLTTHHSHDDNIDKTGGILWTENPLRVQPESSLFFYYLLDKI